MTVNESMEIPFEWLAQAGMQDFVVTSQSYRCTAPHVLIPLTNIERVVRARSLDANGFCYDRMMRILVGIRDGNDIVPPVPVERIGVDQYGLRDGTHRFYASLTLGFSYLPADICEPF